MRRKEIKPARQEGRAAIMVFITAAVRVKWVEARTFPATRKETACMYNTRVASSNLSRPIHGRILCRLGSRAMTVMDFGSCCPLTASLHFLLHSSSRASVYSSQIRYQVPGVADRSLVFQGPSSGLTGCQGNVLRCGSSDAVRNPIS